MRPAVGVGFGIPEGTGQWLDVALESQPSPSSGTSPWASSCPRGSLSLEEHFQGCFQGPSSTRYLACVRNLEGKDTKPHGAQSRQDIPLPRQWLSGQARLGTPGVPGWPSNPGPWGCLAGLLTSGSRRGTAGIAWEGAGGGASPGGPAPELRGRRAGSPRSPCVEGFVWASGPHRMQVCLQALEAPGTELFAEERERRLSPGTETGV